MKPYIVGMALDATITGLSLIFGQCKTQTADWEWNAGSRLQIIFFFISRSFVRSENRPDLTRKQSGRTEWQTRLIFHQSKRQIYRTIIVWWPTVICSLEAGCKMQNEDCRLGVKCRLSINCSHGRVWGQKIPQIHVNDHVLDIYYYKSIPFFSEMSSTTRKHNCNLEPFSVGKTSHLTLDVKFWIHVTMNLYNTTMFTLE